MIFFFLFISSFLVMHVGLSMQWHRAIIPDGESHRDMLPDSKFIRFNKRVANGVNGMEFLVFISLKSWAFWY